eukprot:Em0004g1090a
MSLLQKIVAIILYSGHCSKMVFNRLHRLGLTVSHSTVIRLLDQTLSEIRQHSKTSIHRETFSSSESSDTDQRNSENSSNCSDEDSEMIEDDSCPEADGFVSDEEVIGIDDNGQQENVLSHETVNITQYITNFDSANSEIGYDSAIRCTEAVPFEQLFSNSEQEDDLSSEAVDIAEHVVNVGSENSECGNDSAIRCTEAVPFEQLFSNSEQEDDLSSEAVNIAEHVVNVGSENSECGNDSIRCTESVPFEQLFTEAVALMDMNVSNDNTLSSNIATLVSRVLCKHMKFFNVSFDDVVQWHIHHKYYKEMSQKSQVLTVARMRSAINIKNNSWTATGRLEGFIPVAEDWHTKAIYLDLIWRYFYATSSSNQTGTLYHLKNLLNRTSIPKKAKKQYDACHDFFVLVVEAYILVAAMTELKMDNLDGIPDKTFSPQGNDTWMMPDEDRKQLLHSICNKLVNSPCFHLRYNKPFPGSNGDEMPSKHLKATKVKEQFCVFPKLLESLFQFFQTMMMIIM